MCFVEDEGGVGKMQSACILTLNVWHVGRARTTSNVGPMKGCKRLYSPIQSWRTSMRSLLSFRRN